MQNVDEQKFNGNDGGQDDLLAVFQQFKKHLMKELRVASIAKVKQVYKKDDIIESVAVQAYPMLEDETEKNIECKVVQGLELANNDIVVVLYLDRNFIAALKKLKLNQAPSKLQENIKLHYDQYGIVIAKL